MSHAHECRFCGYEMTVLRRKSGRIAKCKQCGWTSPMLPPTPKPDRTELQAAVARLRYPGKAVKIARLMGVTL
jgi:ribosomal protein L37AE/L43A